MTPFQNRIMRYLSLVLIGLVAIFNVTAQNVGIGTSSPDSKAMLDITSTSKGVLVPRVTTSERNAISASGSMPDGLLVFDTDFSSFYYWNAALNAGAGDWTPLDNTSVAWFEEGTTTVPNAISDNIYTTGQVGIGTTTPGYNLHVASSGQQEPMALFNSTDDDVSIRLQSDYGSSGEAYMEYNNNSTNSNSWQTGLNDGSTFVWRYGSSNTMGTGSDILDGQHLMGLDTDGNLTLNSSATDEDVALTFRTNDNTGGSAHYPANRLRSGWHNTTSTSYSQSRLDIEGWSGSNWVQIAEFKTNGEVTIPGLSGSGERAVTTDANGTLSTAALPAGFPTDVQDMTSTSTVSIPSGCKGVHIKAVGGGGGGGGDGSWYDAGGGGGAGGCVELYLDPSDLVGVTDLVINIGTAGAGNSNSNNGGNGGNTTIYLDATLVATANGGAGGYNGNNYARGGIGGAASITSGYTGFVIDGEDGEGGRDQTGGNTSANASNQHTVAGSGGSSLLGGGGRGAGRTSAAESGGYGAGGGGGQDMGGNPSGAGGSGRAIVIFY